LVAASGVFGLSAWTQAAGARNELAAREPAQAIAQGLRGRDYESLKLVGRLAPGGCKAAP
jgi:hypothetical protein